MPATARIIMPIPAQDFDPTEVAISWRVLTSLGHDVRFATPDGSPGAADQMMLTGRGLDPWGAIPGLHVLPLVGLALRANKDARQACTAMFQTEAFQAPLMWDAVDAASFDGLVLPGGHRARGMRAYLESPVLQKLVADFFAACKPVGAICHGVVLAARSKVPASGKSVLHGRRSTALTWALERKAWSLARITRFWDPDYYRTYLEAPGQAPGSMSVQHEVTRALAQPEDFADVPTSDPHFRKKTSGLARDTMTDPTAAFVVTDGAYVSARWPGDAHTFARQLAAVLEKFLAANLREGSGLPG
jgi:putative intracellular protease/amidase